MVKYSLHRLTRERTGNCRIRTAHLRPLTRELRDLREQVRNAELTVAKSVRSRGHRGVADAVS